MIEPCPECKQPVSSLAKACPHCGFPKRGEIHSRLEVGSLRRISAYKGVRGLIDFLLMAFLILAGVSVFFFFAEGQAVNALFAVLAIVFAIINRALAVVLFDIADALLKRDRRDSLL